MLQSIIFDRKYFTPITATQWIIGHGYNHSKIDIKKNHLRFRQVEPIHGARYATYKVTKGIEFILMYV